MLAAVLAVGGLGGGNATDDMIINNIRASDTWAFFQAKNMRQTAYEIANVEIEGDLAEPGLDPATRARLERQAGRASRHHRPLRSRARSGRAERSAAGEGKRQLSRAGALL